MTDKEFAIIYQLSNELNRDLSSRDLSIVEKLIDCRLNIDININNIKPHLSPGQTIVKQHQSSILGKQKKKRPRKQLMTNTKIRQIFGISDLHKLKLYVNPQIQYKHKLLALDTANQSLTTLKPGKLFWELTNASTASQGVIALNGIVKNIIAVRLGDGKITLSQHHLASAQKTRSMLSIGIEELFVQSFIGKNNFRFHFIQKNMPGTTGHISLANYSDIMEYSARQFNKGWYKFNKPISYLNSVTLRFGDPLNEFPITNNYIYGNVVQGSNPLKINLENYINEFGFPTGEEIINGTLVPIKATAYQFTTGDPQTDSALISSVNGQRHRITVDTLGAGFPAQVLTVTIPIDTSTMTLTDNTVPLLLVWDNAYRKVYPLDIVYLDDQEDEYQDE